MQYEDIQEPIQVYALFRKGKIQPLSFKWGQGVYKISKVTQAWIAPSGKWKLHHFAVMDTQDNWFQLCYCEEDFSWTLIKGYARG